MCGRWLPWRQRGGVCDPCWIALPWSPGTRRFRRGPLCAVVWAGDYGGALRGLIHALKFARFDSLGGPLGDAAAARVRPALEGAIARGDLPSPDLVVPVPLHWTRRWRRGFNQSHLLARGVGGALGLPLSCRALVRRRRGRRQIGLRRHERLVALKGVFGAGLQGRRPSRRSRIAGRVVLLVDDVMTTGATLEACAAALRHAGARAVLGFVVARTPRGAGRGAAGGGRNQPV